MTSFFGLGGITFGGTKFFWGTITGLLYFIELLKYLASLIILRLILTFVKLPKMKNQHFTFSNRQDIDAVLDRNRREKAGELAVDVSPLPRRNILAMRHYWVVPSGYIPGSLDDETPGVGKAFICRLDREALIPKIVPHQIVQFRPDQRHR